MKIRPISLVKIILWVQGNRISFVYERALTLQSLMLLKAVPCKGYIIFRHDPEVPQCYLGLVQIISKNVVIRVNFSDFQISPFQIGGLPAGQAGCGTQWRGPGRWQSPARGNGCWRGLQLHLPHWRPLPESPRTSYWRWSSPAGWPGPVKGIQTF